MNTLTPEFLRGLADKLEAVQKEVANELLIAINSPAPKAVVVEDDKWGFNNPVPNRIGGNTTFNKPIKPMNSSMSVHPDMVKDRVETVRPQFIHAGAKVVIGKRINEDKFLELRQAGFSEGMNFNVVQQAGMDKWLCYSPRSQRKAIISGVLLNDASL